MPKTLTEVSNKDVIIAEVIRTGEKLIIPEIMDLDQAIKLLKDRKEYEQQDVKFSQDYNVLPYDGAHALNKVLAEMYGWAQAKPTPGFFGDRPPEMINVEVAPGVHQAVTWGRHSLPNINGYINTSVNMSNGRLQFSLSAHILRKDEPQVRALFKAVAEYLKTGSIYMGKAIKIRFRDDNGDMLEMPQPTFIDTSKIEESQLIYAAPVQHLVDVNLFTPIKRIHDCIANNMPVKRGVLLGGVYGTGKTMAATVASRLATDQGLTYVYIPRASEFADAVEFAKQYQSPACVIFCEDIDRVTEGERTVKMDDILNILDGIDTKKSNIITVVTTNDLNSINPALLRPGRLDAVIDVTPPDAAAVEKLLRLYGKDTIGADVDLSKAAEAMAGQIPAVVAEVVQRAKLLQLGYTQPGSKVEGISEQAILDAALTIKSQTDLLAERMKPASKDESIDAKIHKLVSKALSGEEMTE